jgi:hypothetical protein
MGTLA